MLKFRSLFSGSSGNSHLIISASSKILIDIGVSAKKMTLCLESLNIDPCSIDGIFITHEHLDHIQGLAVFSNKYNTKIYINKETFFALKDVMREKLNMDNIIFFNPGTDITLKDLTIFPFSIPHDAANPCAFNIVNGNRKISVATDIGHMTNEILEHLSSSAFILLESNYDPNVLSACPYPYHLKQRISGPFGHLSNESAGRAISTLIPTGLKEVMLGHLSKDSNIPELAYESVLNEVNSNLNFTLSVANRDNYSKLIEII